MIGVGVRSANNSPWHSFKRFSISPRWAIYILVEEARLAGITHTMADLLRQRIFGLALGYEDLIDHDQLRHDPALAAVLDKPGGRLAGKSTLNRLEHADKIGQDRHHKFDHDGAAIERLFPEVFMDAFCEPPIRIEIDLDATDDPLYGQQEGRHFHVSARSTMLVVGQRLRI